jgi:3-oxoacyl-[acyl-carrier protein] reductase
MNTVIPGCITFPGGVWDRMSQMMPPVVEGIAKSTMLGRLGVADEIASSVVFLASPRASYTTGASLRIDGGIVKGVDF